MAKIVIIILICLTGLAFPLSSNASDIINMPQFCLLMVSGLMMISLWLFKFNKFAGLLVLTTIVPILNTFLNYRAPIASTVIYVLSIFIISIIYIFIRNFGIKEDCLKYFILPAVMNIIFIFIQQFAPNMIPLKSDEICGLIGNGGLTATFLGMTTPIFIKYFRVGLGFLLAAILLCKGFVGLLAFSVIIGFHFKEKLKLKFLLPVLIILIAIIYFGAQDKVSVSLRLSMFIGTLSGILHHPFIGWGVGSFIEVMTKILPEESIYMGTSFNTHSHVMNHPANEFLFGWWNFGILFLAAMIFYVVDVFKSYTPSTKMVFGILLGGLVTMMLFMFTPPTLFLMTVALAIFENTKGENHGKIQNENAIV